MMGLPGGSNGGGTMTTGAFVVLILLGLAATVAGVWGIFQVAALIGQQGRFVQLPGGWGEGVFAVPQTLGARHGCALCYAPQDTATQRRDDPIRAA